MKLFQKGALIFVVTFISVISLLPKECEKCKELPAFEGPYLGQKLPGKTPQVFAPGIVSTHADEYAFEISPSGNEMLFMRKSSIMLVTRKNDGTWNKPVVAPFSGKYIDDEPCFSPDGNTIYFMSRRPFSHSKYPSNMWVVQKQDGKWMEPFGLKTINPTKQLHAPSVAGNGNVYDDGIVRYQYSNGKYMPAEKIVSLKGRYPFVSPDEKYMIFAARLPGKNDSDLFVSFCSSEGIWSKGVSLGNEINSLANEGNSFVTADGKFLFFSRKFDIYWMDARIIQELKPDELPRNFASYDKSQFHDWPVLRGAYFGQKIPAGKAEIFMDGIISIGNEDEMCAAVTADGREFFFNARYKGKWAIFWTNEVDGEWMRPAPVPFTSDYTDRDFTMSPDGNKIHFGSNRPRSRGASPSESLDIFMTEKLAINRWSEPENIGNPINTDRGENYPSCARNGNLYFFSSRDDGFGGCDIYISRWENGHYAAPENLGSEINSDKHDWDSVIAPDESFIIFSSQNRADSIGEQDLYISYRKGDGSWTAAKNMGPSVNSPHDEICPSLSLDGKCLFFTSRRRGKADIYWLGARIIGELKPDELKRRREP